VKLSQDFRSFDFMSPWEGAEYVLPGDEKAPQAPGAPSPAPGPLPAGSDPKGGPSGGTPKVTAKSEQTGAGEPANSKGAEKSPDAPVKPDQHIDEGKGAAKPEDKA
jgi:NADH-quinone oxidoreductase subunit C